MALQLIDLTTPQPGGKFGDPTKTAWQKVNDNSDYLEERLQQLAIGAGDGSEALVAIQELQDSIDTVETLATGASAEITQLKTDIGSAAYEDSSSFATAGEGALAASAVQPASLVASTQRVATLGQQANLNGAPPAAVVSMVSQQSIASGTQTLAVWSEDILDTDLLHAAYSPSVVCRVSSGVWQASANIVWATNATGIRIMEVLLNGQSVGKSVVPAITGEQTQQTLSVLVPMEIGDDVQVRVWHNAGVAVAVSTASRLQFSYMGAVVGQRKDTAVNFDSSQQYRALSKYTNNPQTILPSRVFLDPDPSGIDRTVMRFNVRPEDNPVLYARAQLATGSFMASGETWWVGIGVYITPNQPLNESLVMLHEIYGPPFGNGPNSLRQTPDGKFSMSNTPESGTEAWYAYEFWSMPFETGKWYDIAFRYTMSQDPAIGSVEVWVNDGTGWKQQLLGPAGNRTQRRLFYDTLRVGGNGNANNYSTIKVAQWEDHPVEAIFSGHKVGASLWDVDPRTYGDLPDWAVNPNFADKAWRSNRILNGSPLPDGGQVATWVDSTSARWGVFSNVIRPSAGSAASVMTFDATIAGGFLQFTLASWYPTGTAGDGSGVVFARVDSANYLRFVAVSGVGWELRATVAGTTTTIGTVQKPPAQGDNVRIHWFDSVVRVSVNGDAPAEFSTSLAGSGNNVGFIRSAGSGLSSVGFSMFAYWRPARELGWGW